MAKIVVVEDVEDLAELVIDYLHAADFQTQYFNEGTDVVEWVKNNNPDLLVLDLNLPGKDGFTICKEIRQFSQIPIIMATARVEDIDRLLGLELGADDYVCKPYNVKEIVARVKAVLRRVNPQTDNSGGITVNADFHTISYQGNSIEVSAVECSLFNLLFKQPGRIYSREQIIDLVYSDYRIVSNRTVDSHIKNLRKKLNNLILTAANQQEWIHSVYGVGYKFEIRSLI